MLPELHTSALTLAARIARSDRFETVATIDFESRRLTLEFRGVLDEYADLDAVWSYITRSPIQLREISLDLGSLERVTSAGLKDWLKFYKRVSARHHHSLSRLGPAMIRLASEILLFDSRHTVAATWSAHFHCSGCGCTMEMDFKVVPNLDTDWLDQLRQSCPDCPGALSFDDDAHAYSLCAKQS